MTKEEKIYLIVKELERIFGRQHLSVSEIAGRISEPELDFYIRHICREGKPCS